MDFSGSYGITLLALTPPHAAAFEIIDFSGRVGVLCWSGIQCPEKFFRSRLFKLHAPLSTQIKRQSVRKTFPKGLSTCTRDYLI